MSRSCYDDDLDQWDLIRWRGAVAAAIRGTRGQEMLHGLVSALDAMPVKALIRDQLIDEVGQVCALGALGVACQRTDDMRKVDPEDYEQVARFFKVSECLAREVQYVNDELSFGESPVARWRRVRAWAESQILAEG